MEEKIIKELIRKAEDNLKNSYAPYSKFNVSAALLAASGKIFTGVNVENAVFGSTICAERNAIVHAVNEGERKLSAIAIVGGENYQIEDYCPPCGECRQVMREFSNPKEMQIILAKSEEDYKIFTLEQLLPESFGPSFLDQK